MAVCLIANGMYRFVDHLSARAISPILFSTCFGISALLASTSFAQVNGPGTSDSALFDTVLSLPGDMASLPDGSQVGGVAGQTTQLNVSAGGTVGTVVDFESGSEVNIDAEVNLSGGTFGSFNAIDSVVNITGGDLLGNSDAMSGSQVNISGGSVNAFSASTGSDVNISGGSLNFNNLTIRSGSDVELIGGEFQLNGNSFNSNILSLNSGDVFSGTLVDGTPFILNDSFEDISITSVNSLTPIVATNFVVDNTTTNVPSGLRSGQTLSLLADGAIENDFSLVNSTLNIDGGELGLSARAVGSEVNVSGGTLGGGFDAFVGSQVNVTGGEVGNTFDAFAGSEINISGGQVGDAFEAFSGSVVNISGGTFGFRFTALSGSEVNLFGSDFQIDGVPIANLTDDVAFTIDSRDVELTGTFLDGTPFSFDLGDPEFNEIEDIFQDGATLTVTSVGVPEPSSVMFIALLITGGAARRRRV